ncbi:Predicted enzyme with a TIM-barrel fold [Moraxella caviae]|nr:Predicted enzyme with a TIM-barrel fold [Moraxella caviae]
MQRSGWACAKWCGIACGIKNQARCHAACALAGGAGGFGENYLQEALAKQALLADLPIVWHYIGSIQRNKTKDIAAHFDWVHTLERGLIAKRLSEQRGEICRQNPSVPPLNVLIQLNIDDEASKSGVLPDELFALVDEVAQLPNLCLRGLMIIPDKAGSDAFVRTQALFDEVRARFDLPQWDTLSMGMSGDMAQAVAHGSTMVRIGTAIFGARDYA